MYYFSFKGKVPYILYSNRTQNTNPSDFKNGGSGLKHKYLTDQLHKKLKLEYSNSSAFCAEPPVQPYDKAHIRAVDLLKKLSLCIENNKVAELNFSW